jgi:hypothetical protein
LPARRGNEITSWKLIAEKPERSCMIEGTTLLLAIQRMGMMLGVWQINR